MRATSLPPKLEIMGREVSMVVAPPIVMDESFNFLLNKGYSVIHAISLRIFAIRAMLPQYTEYLISVADVNEYQPQPKAAMSA